MPVFSVLSFKESKFFVFPLTKYLPFAYSRIFPTFFSFTVNTSLNDLFVSSISTLAMEKYLFQRKEFLLPNFLILRPKILLQ